MRSIIIIFASAAACARGGGGPADRVFVSQAGSQTVAVFNGSTGALERHVEVGLLPHGLLPSPDGHTLYAAVVGSQSIAEIDVASGSLRRTFLTGPVPVRRADGTPNQAHADQGAFTGHTTCYDCHTGAPGGALPKYVGARPFGMLLSADGSRLIVSHLRPVEPDRLGAEPGSLAVIDLRTGSIERTVALAPAGAATEAVALASVGSDVWVIIRSPQPSLAPGVVRRLDPVTLQGRGDSATGADPVTLLPLPGRGTALISNFETNTVSERSASDGAVVRDLVVAPGPLGLVLLPGGNGVLTLDYYFNALSFLDLAAGTTATIPFADATATYANPTQAALATDGRSAWVVSGGTSGRLLQLDLATRTIVRALAVDGLSYGVAVAPGASP
jgi:DNA-binding beta-propeller fold protein YncE